MLYKDYDLSPPKDTHYGLEFLANSPQFIRELMAYRLTRGRWAELERSKKGIVLANTDLKSPTQHMINAIQLLWPEDLRLISMGIPNNYAIDIIELFCTENDWGIAGCGSSGKTYTVSGCINVDWMCAPNITTTYVASTAMEASEDRIWGKVSRLYKSAMETIKRGYGPKAQIGHMVEYRKMIIFESLDANNPDKEYSSAIKTLAFPQGLEGQRAIDSTRGRKNKRMRLFIDELAEMDLNVLDCRHNLIRNYDFMFGGLANPDSKSNNPHKELCEPDHPLKWESVNITTHKWKTRTGAALHLSGDDSPNFKAPPGVVPFEDFLTEQGKQDSLKVSHGNPNAPHYWRNVYGWWMDGTIEQTVMTKTFIHSCNLDYEPRWTGYKKAVCGFDTGFVAGGDRCCASFARFGKDDTGRNVGFYLGTKEYVSSVGSVFEDSIAEQLVKDLISYGVQPRDFGMDISGDGGKMMRAIIIEWSKFNPEAMMVFPISSMGKATDRRVSSTDKRTCAEAYDRRVTEYWFSISVAFSTRSLFGIDLDKHRQLVDELTARLFYHKGRKVSIEKKEDMKARIKKSPDLGDSFAYMVEMLRRAGLEFTFEEEGAEPITITEIKDWEDRLIYKKYGDGSDAPEEDELGYAGVSKDEDGFS